MRADAGEAFVFHGSASGIANGNPATANTLLSSTRTTRISGAASRALATPTATALPT